MQGQRYLVRVYTDPVHGYFSDIYEYWVHHNGKGICFNFNTDYFFDMNEYDVNVFYSEKPRNEIKTAFANKRVKITELEPVTIPIEFFNSCVEYLEAKERIKFHSLNFIKKEIESKSENNKEKKEVIDIMKSLLDPKEQKINEEKKEREEKKKGREIDTREIKSSFWSKRKTNQ